MATFRSTNPARPAEVVIELPEHGAADVDVAVQRAAEAQRAWARAAGARAGRGDRGRRRGPHRPQGRAGRAGQPRGGQDPHRGRRRGAGGHRHGRLRRRSGSLGVGRRRAVRDADKMAWTTRIPVGVVGMITPWNFPMAIPSWKIFPALLAGNGVVMKPSELAPACGVAFVDACVEAGIPADLAPGRARRRRAGRRPRRPPGRRRGVLHRLGAHRPQGGGGGDGGRAEARQPRARRQERHGRARRRRPRPRARRRPVRCLRHVGPALHVDVAPASCSAASPARSSSGSSSGPRRCVLGDPLDADTDVGPVITAESARPHRRA